MPDSDPALPDTLHLPPLPGPLICDPGKIFDARAIRQQITALSEDCNGADLRAGVVKILRDANKAGRAAIAEAFGEEPFAARALTRSYVYLTDGLVTAAHFTATQLLHPIANPTQGERIAVIAVGGYGRGEMAPHSDVDLLFLTPYKITAWAESVIESMLYILWDLRLKVGHSSRTIRDCIRLGGEDFTIRTALLEQRFLDGDEALAQELGERLRGELFSKDPKDFVEAKLAERDARHLKQGQRYVVEPNVKEGKGGLRDLQSLYWIAKYLYQV
ncbi:MAG: nucleotidyltransferase domain-containing protein, partial [Pseudomonadota bacterium]|nr:nucleotidyltransferase domain-containing protein [Pseudomonadota bacterium]